MNTQACLYQGIVWVVDSVDPKTHNLVLKYLGGSQITIADAADVDFIDAQQAAGKLQEQVDERDRLRDIDTDNVSQKRKDAARARFKAITREMDGEIDAEAAAKECSLSLSRYYEVKRMYDARIGVRSLLGQSRGRKIGTKKISLEVEQVICEQFGLWYRGESASRRSVWKGVQAVCDDFNLPKPAYETVCDRIDEYSKKVLALGSHGKDYASDHFDLRADTRELLKPLEQAQMDHTIADCFLRSKDNPEVVIGRPWITLIVCSKTKVILGFSVSFRYPSLGSVAIALRHAVTSKEAFMKRIGLADHVYPYRGVMTELLMDNAREFKSMNLYSACVLENIKPAYRNQKQDGGICERLFGTLNIGAIHVLPGGTGAKPRKDRDYNPAKHALLTSDEFVRELTLGICEYHDTIGGDDHKSPRQRWDECFTGKDGFPSAPAPVHDLKKFILEILPEVYPKVQTSGVQVNTIFYKTPLFKDLVGKKVRVKYDNNNLSRVVVWINGEWVEASATGDPPQTLTELHIINKFRQQNGLLGDRGLAARKARINSMKSFDKQALALNKAREVVARELESGEAPIRRTLPPSPFRVVGTELRDFTRVVDAYPGEDDL
jgi:putative transposase